MTAPAVSVQFQATGVQQVTQAFQQIQRGAQATTAATVGGTAKMSQGTASLIASFNGLSARAFGLTQSFGTLAGNMLPFAVGGPVTAAVLIGLTVLGYGLKLLGNDAEAAAEASRKASELIKQHLAGINSAAGATASVDSYTRRLKTLTAAEEEFNKKSFADVTINDVRAQFERIKERDKVLASREEAVARQAALISAERKSTSIAGRDARIKDAEEASAKTKAFLALDLANQQYAYDRGFVQLKDYFARRSDLIRQNTEAEVAALRAKAAVLATGPIGEKPDEALKRETERRAVLRQIEIAQIESQTKQTQLSAESAKAETMAVHEQAAELGALADVRRLTTEEQLRAFSIESDAKAIIDDTTKSYKEQADAIATLNALKKAGIGLGPRLRDVHMTSDDDPESEANKIKQIIKAKTDAAKDAVRENFATLGIDIGTTFAEGIGAGLGAALIGGNPLKALGEAVLGGLGSIFSQLGHALIQYGVIMSGLLPFLTNIFTSGPAAIAAGIALTALGAAFSGAFSHGGGGRGSSSGAGVFSSGSSVPSTATTVTLNPRSAVGAAPSVAQPVTVVQHIMGPRDPQMHKMIADAAQAGVEKGAGRGTFGRRSLG